MKNNKKKQRRKYLIIGAAAFIAIICIIAFFWLRQHDLFYVFSSPEAMRTYIDGFGAAGPLVFFILQFLQVVIAPIPGNITTVVGAMLFGFWKAFLISFAAIFLASLTCFGIGRLLGRSVVKRFCKQETIDKYLNTMAKEKEYVLYVFFFLPFLPDDLICIIAGMTAMSWGYFTLATIIGRPWGILVSAAVGTGALSFGFWQYFIIGILLIAFSYIAIRYGEKINEAIVAWAKKTTWQPRWKRKKKLAKAKAKAGVYQLSKYHLNKEER